jgi:hypothetical protein
VIVFLMKLSRVFMTLSDSKFIGRQVGGNVVKRVAFALFCTLIVSQADADDDPYANIHTIAIVSALGDGIQLKQDGDFVGSTAPDYAFHTGLDLDGYITARIRDAIALRFTIVQPAIDPALLQKFPLPPDTRQRLLPPSPNTTPDALILVHAADLELRSPPPFVFMSYLYSGFSMTKTTGLFGGHSIQMSAQFEVTVIDTRTGATIASGFGLLPPRGVFGTRLSVPELCSNAIWPADPYHPSAAEARRINSDLMAMIAMSLPNALRVVRLVSAWNDTWITSWDGQPLMCHGDD